MIDTKIHVAIKSYKRAGKVTTHRIAPFAWIYCPESQADAYRQHHGEKVIAIPDAADGNLCRKSNAILDRSPLPWTLILDDDISSIGYWQGTEHHKLGTRHLREMIEHHFMLADELGVKLWGINQNNDEAGYDCYRPFCLLSPILGPFNGHLSPELRYDETVLGKDDYDFWLQNIHAHRRTLRVNKYHYFHDHGDRAGGFVSMRTMATERRGVERMRQKWGKCFQPGGSKGKGCTGANILNSLVRVPIPGC